MYKISSKTIDYYDNDLSMEDLAGFGAPSFVKSAQILTDEQREAIPDDMYAVVIMTKTGGHHRKYPVIDKAHTWLSCRAFNKTAMKLPMKAAVIAASHLKSSCELFGLDIPSYVEKFAAENLTHNKAQVNEAQDMPMEAQVPQQPQGPVRHALTVESPEGLVPMFPLDTPENIHAAIEYFMTNLESFPPGNVQQFASNLVAAAGENSIELPPEIFQMADDTVGSAAQLNINSRQAFAKTPEDKARIQQVAQQAPALGAAKTASLLIKVDRILGADKFYSATHQSPWSAINQNYCKLAVATDYIHDGEKDKSLGIFHPEDLEAYAATKSSELNNHLPREVIERFVADPQEAYKGMSEVQQKIIRDGMNGVL